jgi:hypothetical protein
MGMVVQSMYRSLPCVVGVSLSRYEGASDARVGFGLLLERGSQAEKRPLDSFGDHGAPAQSCLGIRSLGGFLLPVACVRY